MKLNSPVMLIAMVVALTLGATAFRVSTAPERARMRLDSAKATCLNAGGEWIKTGNEESCRPAAQRSNP